MSSRLEDVLGVNRVDVVVLPRRPFLLWTSSGRAGSILRMPWSRPVRALYPAAGSGRSSSFQEATYGADPRGSRSMTGAPIKAVVITEKVVYIGTWSQH
jgi:hypothetical protein